MRVLVFVPVAAAGFVDLRCVDDGEDLYVAAGVWSSRVLGGAGDYLLGVCGGHVGVPGDLIGPGQGNYAVARC